MRDDHQLALKRATACALFAWALSAGALAVVSGVAAQQAPPVWRPPPPIVPMFGAAPVAAAPLPPPVPDRRLHQSDLALRATFAVSLPPSDSLDDALASRGYSTDRAALGLDLTLTHRAIWLLFLGARVGTRWRSLASNTGRSEADDVQISGTDVLAVAELRLPFGAIELSPDVAAGISYAETVESDGSVARAGPRFSAGVSFSFWIVDPLRLVARLAWDLYPVIDVNRFGHDVALGGPTFDIGVEWRPR